MKIPKEIRARRGDRVLPKWRKLLEFIANTGVITGPGVRIAQGPNGTQVIADHFQKPWNHPFRVSVSGNEARVRPGLVNGLSPFVEGTQGATSRLDGTNAEGEDVDVPVVPLSYDGERATSVSLVLNVEEGGDSIEIIDDPEHFRIAHTPLPSLDPAGGTVSTDLGEVVYPLALIYWDADDGLVEKKHQVVHHNLGYRFLQGNAQTGRPVRHFFWAT